MREASNAALAPVSIKGRLIRSPTFGRVFLVLIYIMILMVLCFYKLQPGQRSQLEDIGYRTGWISVAQLPLIFLLAGKNNIIGYLTGVSHEKLNWMHRWSARSLLLTSTIHMAFWFKDWWPYGTYVSKMIKTNYQANKGFVAWVLLFWIVVSSIAPIRRWKYEIFVIQHLLSFTAFITFVYLHAFDTTRMWVWIPVGIFFFDRITRGILLLYTNLSIFHPRQRKQGAMSGFWACKADFVPLPHGSTKITIRNPPVSWSPGQHVFVSCHSIVPLQSHPFTIASIPQDGEMVFIVKAEKGSTKRFFDHAEKQQAIYVDTQKSREVRSMAIQGPYGCIRPLRQFDSVVFLAGSTGATYTMPLLRDLVKSWQVPTNQPTSFFRAPGCAVTRHIRFVWVVKSRGQLEWFSAQLATAMEDALLAKTQRPDLSIEVSIYVTCDDSFTQDQKSLLSTPGMKRNPNSNPHGKVEEISSIVDSVEEKSKTKETDIAVQSRPNSNDDGCGPDGTCCCQTTIDDEPSNATATQCCCGANKKLRWPLSPTSSTSTSMLSPQLHSSIAVIGGRPQCRNIIRRTLEQAKGESAVVVCGPEGLVDDVKQSVVSLSDERAVHKGTGAQGIYLHTESFCF